METDPAHGLPLEFYGPRTYHELLGDLRGIAGAPEEFSSVFIVRTQGEARTLFQGSFSIRVDHQWQLLAVDSEAVAVLEERLFESAFLKTYSGALFYTLRIATHAWSLVIHEGYSH